MKFFKNVCKLFGIGCLGASSFMYIWVMYTILTKGVFVGVEPIIPIAVFELFAGLFSFGFAIYLGKKMVDNNEI